MMYIVYYFTIFCFGSIFSSSLLTTFIWPLKKLYCSFATPVYFFNPRANDKYSNLLIIAAFPSFLKVFFWQKILVGWKLYLPTFPDYKSEALAVCLSKLYWPLFCSIFLSIVLIFFANSHLVGFVKSYWIIWWQSCMVH